MIKLLAIGHLGKDVLVNEVNGKKVMNFSIAHTEKWKGADGVMREKTTWVECSYWNDNTAIAPYLKKGTQVYIEGTPEVNAYSNSEGEAKASQRCRVFSIQLLGSANAEKKTNIGSAEGTAAAPPQETAESLEQNKMPF